MFEVEQSNIIFAYLHHYFLDLLYVQLCRVEIA